MAQGDCWLCSNQRTWGGHEAWLQGKCWGSCTVNERIVVDHHYLVIRSELVKDWPRLQVCRSWFPWSCTQQASSRHLLRSQGGQRACHLGSCKQDNIIPSPDLGPISMPTLFRLTKAKSIYSLKSCKGQDWVREYIWYFVYHNTQRCLPVKAGAKGTGEPKKGPTHCFAAWTHQWFQRSCHLLDCLGSSGQPTSFPQPSRSTETGQIAGQLHAK